MPACLAIIPASGESREPCLPTEEKAVRDGSLYPSTRIFPGGFDFYEGMKETVKSGKAEIVTTEEYGMKLGPVNVSDNSKYHLDNWIDCMRARNLDAKWQYPYRLLAFDRQHNGYQGLTVKGRSFTGTGPGKR